MGLAPLRPAQLAAEITGAIHRDLFRWLHLLLKQGNANVLPIGMVTPAKLSADDISTYFDGTGLGKTARRWDGWAICNGSNGTPDLDGEFLRFEASASGGTGNLEATGAGTYYELVPVMRVA